MPRQSPIVSLVAAILTAGVFWADGRAAEPTRPGKAALVDVKLEELQAAFRKDHNRALDAGDYREVSLAVNRWVVRDRRGAYVGRWNAEEGADETGAAVYGIALIDAHEALEVKAEPLQAVFKQHFNRPLDVKNHRQVQQAINRWLAANRRRGYLGHWDVGEKGEGARDPVYRVVPIRPASLVGVKVDELRATFKKHFNRPLDVNNYREVTLAVNRWLPANKLDGYFGFWDAEERVDGAGATVYEVALIQPVEPAELVYVPNSTRRVCQLTGDIDRASRKLTLSQTGKRFGVHATDLGSSFEHRGRLYFLFGDTGPQDRDVLAWTESTDPHRIALEFYKGEGDTFYPLTVPGLKQGAFEVPSGGISIRDTMYVVCTTDHSDEKQMGRSVLARSRDDGRTFTKLHDLSRSKFINVSFWLADGWLYIYGSGNYRKSNVCLARVRPADVENRSRLEYFTGTGPGEEPRWSRKEAEAVPLFEHRQVGEVSVSYLKPVNRYVMLYNTEKPRGIMMRSAQAPWGPWSDGAIVFDPGRDNGYGHFMHMPARPGEKRDALSDPGRADQPGGEYGPYIMSRFTTGGGWACRIYYTMSTWNPYQVVVMQTDLALRREGE